MTSVNNCTCRFDINTNETLHFPQTDKTCHSYFKLLRQQLTYYLSKKKLLQFTLGSFINDVQWLFNFKFKVEIKKMENSFTLFRKIIIFLGHRLWTTHSVIFKIITLLWKHCSFHYKNVIICLRGKQRFMTFMTL